jgi:hypothetical protein
MNDPPEEVLYGGNVAKRRRTHRRHCPQTGHAGDTSGGGVA